MKTIIYLIKKLKVKISKRILSWIFKFLYTPKEVAVDFRTINVKVKDFVFNEDNKDYSSCVYEIPQGRLFTDRANYIAVSRRKFLIPGASWHWDNGEILPHSKNPALSRGTPKPIVHYKGNLLSLLTGGGGNRNYYHWLYDVLPRIRLCESSLHLDKIDRILVPEISQHFQLETLDWLNISRKKLVSSENIQHLSAENLIVTDHPNPNWSYPPQWIVNWLRDRFLFEAKEKNPNPGFNTRVYIKRGDSFNNRRLLNEDKIVNFLQKKGFSCYSLSQLSVLEQICLFSNAEIVVGVHGAGFSNLAFSSPETKVIEIFSNVYKPKLYERISMYNSLNYIPVISNDVELNKLPQIANLIVSVEELRKHI